MHFVFVKTEREYLNISIIIWLNQGIEIQMHLFWLKQVIRKNALLASIKGMLTKNGHNSASIGSFRFFVHLHDPQIPLYEEKFTSS